MLLAANWAGFLISVSSITTFGITRLEWLLVAVGYGLLAGLAGQAIVAKAQTLKVKVRPFIEAAQIAGGSKLHIIGLFTFEGAMACHSAACAVHHDVLRCLLPYRSRAGRGVQSTPGSEVERGGW